MEKEKRKPGPVLRLDPIVRRVTVSILQEKLTHGVQQQLSRQLVERHARQVVGKWMQKNRPKLDSITKKHLGKQITEAKKKAMAAVERYIKELQVDVSW